MTNTALLSLAAPADETVTVVDPVQPMRIAVSTLCQIAATIGSRPAEYGGMLGSGPDGVVRHFVFDRGAERGRLAYTPDARLLNRIYREEWKPRGIRLAGFVHSHPPGVPNPSCADAGAAALILEAFPDLDRLLLPIVLTEPDTGSFEFRPHVALRDGHPVRLAAVDLACVADNDADDVVLPSSAWPATAPGKGFTPLRIRRVVLLRGLAAIAGIVLAAMIAAAMLGTPPVPGRDAPLRIDPPVAAEDPLPEGPP
ncbi:MAG: hypothetical protein EPO55_00665 [Reyranella sp.]|uniref:hypothetical protein n=1 Tax=Reyranella sp. TaxID=1929291 RepID=UPI00121B6F83|nr:hypothetical protein [Reyranella sp.]TAJ42773.1 MAG: hypothetical protein EPO55_00665 [Reyranella sp.]